MNVGNMCVVPNAIGSLYHLKFLSLRGIHDVPSSIGNLKNLQTLIVDVGYTCQLPREIADLINLRHLVAPYSKPLAHISKLTSLQVLRNIFCDQWKDVDPVDLVNLRELRMDSIKKSYSLNNISTLKNLSTLVLFCDISSPFPDLEFVNSCEKLQKLWLEGRLEKMPLFPDSITMITLFDSQLMEDPMPILGRLPNLRNLRLSTASYEEKEIMCSDNSFSQLQFLHLYDLENLSTLVLFGVYDDNSSPFPDLEFVNSCEKLQKFWLGGRLEKLPLFPDSITMMLLENSKLTEDPMPILGRLPNLRNLQLFRASYEGKEIMCSDNSFSQLEFLHLEYLGKLERWDLGTSAMPLIKGLLIHNCPNLKEIPERMKYVELLKRSNKYLKLLNLNYLL